MGFALTIGACLLRQLQTHFGFSRCFLVFFFSLKGPSLAEVAEPSRPRHSQPPVAQIYKLLGLEAFIPHSFAPSCVSGCPPYRPPSEVYATNVTFNLTWCVLRRLWALFLSPRPWFRMLGSSWCTYSGVEVTDIQSTLLLQASAAYPENTLASFEAAIRDGAEGIESGI